MEDPTYERYTYALMSFPYSLLWRQYSDSEQSYVSNSAHASSLCSYAMSYLHQVMARSFVHVGASEHIDGYRHLFYIHWPVASQCTSAMVSSVFYGSRSSCQSKGLI